MTSLIPSTSEVIQSRSRATSHQPAFQEMRKLCLMHWLAFRLTIQTVRFSISQVPPFITSQIPLHSPFPIPSQHLLMTASSILFHSLVVVICWGWLTKETTATAFTRSGQLLLFIAHSSCASFTIQPECFGASMFLTVSFNWCGCEMARGRWWYLSFSRIRAAFAVVKHISPNLRWNAR